MCFGGGTTKQKLLTPKAGAEEGKFLGTAGALLPQILSEMGFDLNTIPATDKKGKPTFSITKRALTPEEQANQDWEKQLRDQAQGTLTGGGLNLSPEVLAMVDQIYNQQQSLAQQQIQRTAIAAAGNRGLNLSDTPIGDPLLRATGESATAIRAAQAKALLGLREAELTRASGQVQYLDQLKQLRGFQNPLQVSQFAGGLGSSLMAGRMQGRRVVGGQPTDSGIFGGGGLGSLLQGGGQGLAALFPPKAPSFAGQTASLAGTGWSAEELAEVAAMAA